MSKKISIVIPCYNQAKYLDDCLNSISAQTTLPNEVIVVNDGSTDNFNEEYNELINKYRKIDIKCINQENKGLSTARNVGIKFATGNWILPLDADDKIEQNYLELLMSNIKTDSDIIYGDAYYFGKKSGRWELPTFSINEILRHNIVYCSAIFSKRMFELNHGYDSNLYEGWEDWEFWINSLTNSANFKKIDGAVFLYRVKNKSMVNSMSKQYIEYARKYVIKKHSDYYYEKLGFLPKVYSQLDAEKKKNESLTESLNKINSKLVVRLLKKINIC